MGLYVGSFVGRSVGTAEVGLEVTVGLNEGSVVLVGDELGATEGGPVIIMTGA